jgi:hypothetical protein
MESCAKTLMRGFSDRLSVLVPSPYAYQKALSLVSAISQVVRLASFAPAARFLQMELGAPDMASLGGLTPTPQVNLGSYSFALGPPEC